MKKQLWFQICSGVFFIFLTSCATTRTPRAPAEYLFNTDKSTTVLLSDLKKKLTENKYEIKTFDIETGFLVSHPRRFAIPRGGDKGIGRQTIQIRQEGGSVKIRSIYDCEYEYAGNVGFEPCIVEDEEATFKIQRVESLMLKMIKDNLMKHKEEQ